MATEIRNLGYIAWKNNLSWIEKQKGPKWDSLLERENNRFNNALEGLTIPTFKKSSEDGTKFGTWTITSEPFSPEQTWSLGTFKCKCWDFDLSEDMCVAAIQDPNGFERFSVEIYKISNKKVSHLKNSEISLQNYLIYFSYTNRYFYDVLQSFRRFLNTK